MVSTALNDSFIPCRTDNINVLRAKLPELKKELDDPSMFREIYKYSFSFAKDPGQKSLALDVAIPLWKILLQKKYQEVYEWCNFLEVSSPLWFETSLIYFGHTDALPLASRRRTIPTQSPKIPGCSC